MIKRIITEISEEDFRKLDLKGYRSCRKETENKNVYYALEEVSLNDILDDNLNYILESGYEYELEDLTKPVTIAIHEPYTEEDLLEAHETFPRLTEEECKDLCLKTHCYMDKYMNRFTGPESFEIGFGIDHLYSTRDFYESREDYWRVSKRETKVIYRIKLSDKWKNKFVVKHYTDLLPRKYDTVPDGVDKNYIKAEEHIEYSLNDDGEYEEVCRTGCFYYEHSMAIIPIDKDGKRYEK